MSFFSWRGSAWMTTQWSSGNRWLKPDGQSSTTPDAVVCTEFMSLAEIIAGTELWASAIPRSADAHAPTLAAPAAFPQPQPMLHELTVPPNASGQRLDIWLESALEGCTRSLIARLIKDGRCAMRPGKAKAGYFLRGGERISIEVPAIQPMEVVAEDIP